MSLLVSIAGGKFWTMTFTYSRGDLTLALSSHQHPHLLQIHTEFDIPEHLQRTWLQGGKDSSGHKAFAAPDPAIASHLALANRSTALYLALPSLSSHSQRFSPSNTQLPLGI